MIIHSKGLYGRLWENKQFLTFLFILILTVNILHFRGFCKTISIPVILQTFIKLL